MHPIPFWPSHTAQLNEDSSMLSCRFTTHHELAQQGRSGQHQAVPCPHQHTRYVFCRLGCLYVSDCLLVLFRSASLRFSSSLLPFSLAMGYLIDCHLKLTAPLPYPTFLMLKCSGGAYQVLLCLYLCLGFFRQQHHLLCHVLHHPLCNHHWAHSLWQDSAPPVFFLSKRPGNFQEGLLSLLTFKSHHL